MLLIYPTKTENALECLTCHPLKTFTDTLCDTSYYNETKHAHINKATLQLSPDPFNHFPACHVYDDIFTSIDRFQCSLLICKQCVLKAVQNHQFNLLKTGIVLYVVSSSRLILKSRSLMITYVLVNVPTRIFCVSSACRI